MSFPASGVESAYRNSLKDVAKMLKTRHEENYLVRLMKILSAKVKIQFTFSSLRIYYHVMYIFMCTVTHILVAFSYKES